MKKRMMKKGIALAMGLLCATLFAVPSFAVSIPVYIGGRTFSGGVLVNSRTCVPIRAFSETVASPEIEWNEVTRTATIRTDTLTVTAKEGTYYITVNGEQIFSEAAVFIRNDRIHVPVRPLASAFSLPVRWDDASRSVHIGETETPEEETPSYSEEDLYWLSRIIFAESRGESYEGKLAVGTVILNRVAYHEFPNTVYDVIFDSKYAVQFTPTANGTIYQTPDADSVAAAKQCLEGYRTDPSILYFLNPAIATNFWIVENRPFVMTIGNHDFYA